MEQHSRRGDEMKIAEQAAEWISELSESNDKRAAFFEWLKGSPRHVEETLFVLALSKEASMLDKSSSDALIAQIKDHANVVALPAAETPSATRSYARSAARWKWAASIAACALLSAALAFWMRPGASTSQEYSTAVGEQRAFTLQDGSLVQLNTQSRLEIHYSSQARELRLIEGEALFTVKRDTARPFRVKTDGAIVQALGTQFNVYHQHGDTRVAVIEGLVQVSTQSKDATRSSTAAQLPAGEQVDVTNGHISQRKSLDVAKTTAWRQRRLVFEDDTLKHIADEFNRYNSQVLIRVDVGIESERFTGTFDADSPETFVSALTINRQLEVERGAGVIGIRAQTQDR